MFLQRHSQTRVTWYIDIDNIVIQTLVHFICSAAVHHPVSAECPAEMALNPERSVVAGRRAPHLAAVVLVVVVGPDSGSSPLPTGTTGPIAPCCAAAAGPVLEPVAAGYRRRG